MGFTHDRVYYFSKTPSHVGHLLGELQVGSEGFNMSFVLDGTKDSTKIVVHSYSIGNTIEPNTIIWHENTGTWWIVSNDKVSRFINESGYLYVHQLELVGAIELLNARDLTDCGYRNDRYTFQEFIERLFSLSTFEYDTTLDTNNLIDGNLPVDYLKTFENYTLLSALREFLDGYNLSARLVFTVRYRPATGTRNIIGARLSIISKTGDTNLEKLDSSDFEDVRQITTINKNSFGTTVVSNAENVVSTTTKVFPLMSGAMLSGEQYTIKPDNAIIRLPSKVHNVEWVKMACGVSHLTIAIAQGESQLYYFDPFSDDAAFNILINNMKTFLNNQGYTDASSWLDNNLSTVINKMHNNNVITFYNGVKYNPVNDTFSSLFERPVFKNHLNQLREYVLGDKSLREGVLIPTQVMYWERGSDLIKGFDMFGVWNHNSPVNPSDPYDPQNNPTLALNSSTPATEILYQYYENNIEKLRISITSGNYGSLTDPADFKMSETLFQVKYTPMSDLKVKLDNSSTGNDIQLYNQNGKLTDSNALSKLLLSYSKEITSDNITKYQVYYDTSEIPVVGQMVDFDGTTYVINNVSLQYYLNESQNSSYCYYVEGEFTMSKYVATKSLMTNPNTNIRDYGIPQNNTVKRKQLYRDFYEFGAYNDTSADSEWYMPYYKILNLANVKQNYQDHKALIQVKFSDDNRYYYQLDTTIYQLKKSLYEIVDFGDNNIIGYDMQNIQSGFDITRVLTTNTNNVNTPISYVDDNGELESIYISMCNAEQLGNIYYTIGSGFGCKLAPRCFINQAIYNATQDYKDFSISEPTYNKDALEIPVFEYVCQFDDSPDVIVGENILKQDYYVFDGASQNKGFIYTWVLVPKGSATPQTALNYAPTVRVYSKNGKLGFGFNSTNEGMNGGLSFTQADITNTSFKLSFWKETHMAYDGTFSTTSMTPELDDSYDILVFRTPYGALLPYNNYTDLMFMITNAEDFIHTARTLTIKVNHYKIK